MATYKSITSINLHCQCDFNSRYCRRSQTKNLTVMVLPNYILIILIYVYQVSARSYGVRRHNACENVPENTLMIKDEPDSCGKFLACIGPVAAHYKCFNNGVFGNSTNECLACNETEHLFEVILTTVQSVIKKEKNATRATTMKVKNKKILKKNRVKETTLPSNADNNELIDDEDYEVSDDNEIVRETDTLTTESSNGQLTTIQHSAGNFESTSNPFNLPSTLNDDALERNISTTNSITLNSSDDSSTLQSMNPEINPSIVMHETEESSITDSLSNIESLDNSKENQNNNDDEDYGDGIQVRNFEDESTNELNHKTENFVDENITITPTVVMSATETSPGQIEGISYNFSSENSINTTSHTTELNNEALEKSSSKLLIKSEDNNVQNVNDKNSESVLENLNENTLSSDESFSTIPTSTANLLNISPTIEEILRKNDISEVESKTQSNIELRTQSTEDNEVLHELNSEELLIDNEDNVAAKNKNDDIDNDSITNEETIPKNSVEKVNEVGVLNDVQKNENNPDVSQELSTQTSKQKNLSDEKSLTELSTTQISENENLSNGNTPPPKCNSCKKNLTTENDEKTSLIPSWKTDVIDDVLDLNFDPNKTLIDSTTNIIITTSEDLYTTPSTENNSTHTIFPGHHPTASLEESNEVIDTQKHEEENLQVTKITDETEKENQDISNNSNESNMIEDGGNSSIPSKSLETSNDKLSPDEEQTNQSTNSPSNQESSESSEKAFAQTPDGEYFVDEEEDTTGTCFYFPEYHDDGESKSSYTTPIIRKYIIL